MVASALLQHIYPATESPIVKLAAISSKSILWLSSQVCGLERPIIADRKISISLMHPSLPSRRSRQGMGKYTSEVGLMFSV